ncbi:MAG TPA: hypothetical protein VKA21_10575 [Candidatus Binatia bacterium]|nr:hypothetical protein [Candidatus Binatia bacterium]
MATRMDVEVVEVPIGTPGVLTAWPVSWSAAWVGALSALAATTIGALCAVAFGAHHIAAPGGRLGPEDLGLPELIASVCIAFFAFVIAGWATARVAGIRRAETAMVHGAIAWLVAMPLLFMLIALGARSYFGGWYGGLAGAPVWAAPGTAIAAEAAQEAAGGTVTALLIGLVGAVLGGWMGSGEPMTFTHYRNRNVVRR